MKKIIKIKLGFTLAEVLITLGIIGIVAALTLPALIQKQNEKETVVKLKKFNTVMDQAIKMAVSQNGEISEWGLTAWTGSNPDASEDEIKEGDRSRNAFWAKVLPQLKVLNVCKYGDACNNDQWSRESLDGTKFNYFNKRVTLADGTMIVGSTIYSSDCSNSYGTGALHNVCGEFFVDINGKRPPNATGKDVFLFFITKNGVMPMGSADQVDGFTFDPRCNISKKHNLNGYGCAAWVIYNENLDYLHCNDLVWDGKTKCK